MCCLRDCRANGEVSDVLTVIKDGNDIDSLNAETLTDLTLAVARGLADRQQQGYRWVDGLVMKFYHDVVGNSRNQMVLPTSFRAKVLELVHEKCEYFFRKKFLSIVRRSFTWPGMTADVNLHCKSCKPCQTYNKAGPPRVPMV